MSVKVSSGSGFKMAAQLWKACNTNNIINFNTLTSVRYGHRLRGKAPGVSKSLADRLDDTTGKDVSLHNRVNIGFPHVCASRSVELKQRLQQMKINKSPELEKLARQKKLLVDISTVKEDWLTTAGPYHIKKIADHYSIFDHLFGDAYFIPNKPLKILFGRDESTQQVLYGNVIKPQDTVQHPSVNFKSKDDSLWTLVMTNPDGHFTEPNAELCHWFIGNIPGNDISKGDVIVDYMQPFPPRGTGYHRYIFVLYKQLGKIDYSSLKNLNSSNKLADRTFSTLEFYKERQNNLTPCGLSFFQADWDNTLTDFFHNTLNMQEPVFEYNFPAPFIKQQKWFPLRKPFNTYMDKYKNPKDVNERYFKEKLKNLNPLEKPQATVPFPNAEPIPDGVPSWLKLEIRKKRLGWGRINEV